MMDLIALKKDVLAVEIPSGDKITLSEGMAVSIHQVLGGNYTVQTDDGRLARIDGKDADALGKEVTEAPVSSAELADEPDTVESVTKDIWEQLRTVFDPEIPVNVVELGLIYECDVTPAGAEKFDVAIKMTLTAPGCGMGPVLQEDARSKIDGLPSVGGVEIEIVLEPGWEPSMMSEAARLELGM
jgi:probable FeS assembly SUF system protein SufT